MSNITLYDIPSKLTPQAWSPNTWKARLVLNYKRIPYKTVWLSYPDIEPTLVSLGCAPTATWDDNPSRPLYTLPAIVDTSTTPPAVIADSLAIAEYLDDKYPDRPVFPKHGKALQYAFEDCFLSYVGPHVDPILLPASCAILDDRGSIYFRQTRESHFNKPFEQFSPPGEVRESHWRALEAGFDKLAAVLDKNGLGVDYVAGGTEPTRADMVYLAFLIWIKAVVPDEWEKRIKDWSGGRWERLLNQTEQWQVVV